MTKPLKRILIMAGGTGGHVFPALALADYFRVQNVEVHWLGTERGLEAQVVPAAHIPLHFISIGGVRGKGVSTLIKAPMKILSAIRQAKKIIKQINPDVIIGMGGFASGPGGIAGWWLGCPLVIHEQNAKAGFTNRLLARFARKVMAGFPDTFQIQDKVKTIGNPVRDEITKIPPPQQRLHNNRSPFHLLVLGGSLGAQALNEVVPQALAKLKPSERPIIWHQTGKKLFDTTQALYHSLQVEARLVPFIEEMAEAYTWADMVLCRAGALTIAELCTTGLGAILVPYPHAVDDHQTANARFMVQHEAAFLLPQTELTPERLAELLQELNHNAVKRLAMAQAAYQLRKNEVVETFYQICKEICH